jgi:hypothetical protein
MTSNENFLRIPGRKDFSEENEDVFCDPLFRPAINTMLEGVEGLHAYVHSVSQEHMTASRPVRERKPAQR